MKLQIDLDIPYDLIDAELQDHFAATCKEEAVLRLFADRKIPSAVATRLLGLTRIQFMELTRQRGIAYIVYTAEDFADDLKDLAAFERRIDPTVSGKE